MNQVINFFWTILCFIPVVGFWIGADAMLLLYVLIFISFLSLVVPGRLLQLSNNPKFYERLGIKFTRKFVQNGDYANRLIRRRDPKYRVVKNKTHAASYMGTIKMFERYHFMCFIFFLLTTAFAFIIHEYMFCIIIFIANIIYNISPILLQQYNRARIIKVTNRPARLM
jgi:hypothetical protein